MYVCVSSQCVCVCGCGCVCMCVCPRSVCVYTKVVCVYVRTCVMLFKYIYCTLHGRIKDKNSTLYAINVKCAV